MVVVVAVEDNGIKSRRGAVAIGVVVSSEESWWQWQGCG